MPIARSEQLQHRLEEVARLVAKHKVLASLTHRRTAEPPGQLLATRNEGGS
jgi:hypothetical protein